MRDPFEEPRRPGTKSLLAGIFLLLGVFLAFHAPSHSPVSLIGTIESAGTASVAKIQGGTREAASVRLDSGRLVMASVAFGGPLSAGDRVLVLEQSRLIGPNAYQVVGKQDPPGQ